VCDVKSYITDTMLCCTWYKHCSF